MRERLGFFTAGRWQDTSQTQSLPQTNAPFDTTTSNNRFEIKGTGTLAKNHQLQGNYIRDHTDQTRVPFPFSIDPHVAENPTFPNDLIVATYNGVLSSKLLANFQVSCKTESFVGSGGTNPDIHESPFITQGAGQRLIWYWRQGRLREASSASEHVLSWKCLLTRCSVRRALVAEWYGPK